MWTIISRDNCPHCENAKELLTSLGHHYTEHNLETNSSKWVLSLMKEANLKTVPQVFNHYGTRVGGYSELRELLVKGY